MPQEIVAPWIMWLSLTDFCNNECVWCYEQCSRNQHFLGPMKLENAEKILKIMKEVGVKKCILIGGEPSLHPNLFDVIKLIRGRGMESALVTNGRVFCSEKKVAQLKEAGPDFITISVHGWNGQKYAEFTGSKSGFSNVTSAVGLFKKYDIKFDINFTLSTLSSDFVDEIVSLGKLWHINHIGFNLAAPAVSTGGIQADFVPSLQAMRRQVLDAFEKCKEAGIRCSFLLTIPHCVFTEEELIALFRENSINCGCQMLHGSGIIFQPDGSIALCNHLLDFQVANSEESADMLVSRESFLKFWNSEQLVELRKKSNRLRSEECNDCNHWDVCGGGCLVRWAHYNPRDFNFRKIDIRDKLVDLKKSPA